MTRRRGFVLPVVLVVIGLLAVTMAGFMYFVRAELSAARAERDGQQARLAAESGLQEVIVALRTAPNDLSAWYDVPDEFRHALVWSEAFEREDDPMQQRETREDLYRDEGPAPVTWRYSVCAPRHDTIEEKAMRFGITPEASKLNINVATTDELRRLLEATLPRLGLENTPELVDALIDWRDEDDEMRPNGAETDYYDKLDPPYRAKNGPLDTVGELLLVKGFSAAVLWGEDYNRNGILDENEDDGDLSFPYYDNADGILDFGIGPFITVWSREPIADPNSAGGDPNDATGDPNDATGDPNDAAGDPNTPSMRNGDVLTGRIHVATAPARVLQCLDGITPDIAADIVARRRELDPESLQNVNWLVTSGAVDPGTLAGIQDRLTTNALQFHVEVVGYGDHTKLAKRYEWILELRGPVAQVVSHRDLTELGFAWPIDDENVIVETP